MRTCLIFLILWCVAKPGNTQDQKWLLQSNVGIGLPFGKLKEGKITDPLITYNETYAYWQFLTATYFFKPNWGVNLTVQGNFFSDATSREATFLGDLDDQFGDQYFITMSPLQYGDQVNVNANLYLGITHQKRFKRMRLLSKVQIGATSFRANSLNVYLQEKGTNQYLHITYVTNDRRSVKDHFTLLVGSAACFSLSKSISLEINTQLSGFITNFTYLEEVRNTFTEARQVESIEYRKLLANWTIGIGLGYAF